MATNWQIKKLGEVLNIQNGYAFDSKKFSNDEGIPLIRIRDLKNGISTETRYVGDYDEKYVVHNGDFLIGMDGEFICYQWKVSGALLNQRVCRLQNFSNLLYPRFLFYAINKHLKEIEDVTAYITVKHIASKQIANIEIPLPPFSEQQRIVKILDGVFENVANVKENTEKNLQNSKELFESYLRSIFANPGKDWEEKRLGDVCKVIAGQSPEGKFYNKLGKGLPFYQGKKEFGEKYIGKPTTWTTNITKEAIENDILMSVRAPVGPINFATQKICIGRGLAAIRSEKDIDKNFMFYGILSKEKEIVGNTGAVFASINKNNIENLEFFIPSLAAQKSIVKKLDALSAETKKLEAIYKQKLADLEELKKSVLKKAFNGEL